MRPMFPSEVIDELDRFIEDATDFAVDHSEAGEYAESAAWERHVAVYEFCKEVIAENKRLKEDTQELFDAFCAGFAESGPGWNGQDATTEALRESFNQYLA